MRKMTTTKKVIGYILMVVVAIWILAPIYWLVISSLSTQASLLKKPIDWIPDNITLKNYMSIFASTEGTSQAAEMFTTALYNSVFVSFFVTLISLLVGIPAAYSFSRLKFKGRRIGMITMIATRMIPVV